MDRHFERKVRAAHDAKMAIALEVYDRFISVDPNPRVFIDAGTSAAAVATVLQQKVEEEKEKREKGESIPQRRVFTHNLAVWEKLRGLPDIDLYLAGGRYNSQLNAILEGELFLKFLDLGCNIAVIAVSGVDPRGLWCSNIQDEAIIKNHLAKAQVDKRLIIADFSKIGVNDVKTFFPLKRDEKKDFAQTYLITNNIREDDPELYDQDVRHREKYEETERAFIQEFGTPDDKARIGLKGGAHSDGRVHGKGEDGDFRWIEVSINKWKRRIPGLFEVGERPPGGLSEAKAEPESDESVGKPDGQLGATGDTTLGMGIGPTSPAKRSGRKPRD